MRVLRIFIGCLIAIASGDRSLADEAAAEVAPAKVDYAHDVKPILSGRCYACHGPLKQEHGLRVDTVAAIRQGGEGGPAIEAHSNGESLLISAVTGADGWRMPPEGEPLTHDQIALLKAWIDTGATGPADERPAIDPRQHWAYQPPLRPPVPAVEDASCVRNPIDAFVAAEHQKHGTRPLALAAPHVLLRRLYLDLIGLPPTADELAAFLSDSASDAYEKVVDRLLASPQYGERWARQWMDVWRYSDWYGWAAEVRHSQPHIWRWRDWIIESLNADKGYDQMVLEMLAGDELAPADQNVLRATGYLVRNWYRYNRDTWLEDTVEHTGKAFLAITFNCARCHDHKFDPIPQQDYYQLRAFFEPHQIRTDFAGDLDRTKVGLVRVFDGEPEKPTYLFVRGDQRQPDQSKSLPPALPAILCGQPLKIEPVPLPLESWRTSLNPRLQQAALGHSTADVTQSQTALQSARDKLAAAQQKLAELSKLAGVSHDHAEDVSQVAVVAHVLSSAVVTAARLATEQEIHQLESELVLAQKTCAAAADELLSIQAKIAAERAKAAEPPDPAVDALAVAAGQAERRFAQATRELELLKAEQALVAAKAKHDPADEKTKQPLAKAEARLKELTKALEDARAAAANPTADYNPLDKTYPATSTGRRLALARWIASRGNPLTARVAVNHIWLRHFGRALVPTVFDFGLSGQTPTNPALFDWLAVELMENGWSMKRLHRLIVTSSVYRLASGPADETNARIDPDNRLLWRANVRRADAEVIRDSLLQAAGTLDCTAGGPELDHKTADTTNRRSIYYRQASEKRVTFLEIFDQPGGGEGYERTESIVPQQALALLNSGFALQHAGTLAQKLWERTAAASASSDVALSAIPTDREHPPMPDSEPAGSLSFDSARSRQFVELAFRQILSRDPTALEQAECEAFLREQAIRLANDTQDKTAPASAGSAANPDAAARARADLVHVLFNHNDFVAIR